MQVVLEGLATHVSDDPPSQEPTHQMKSKIKSLEKELYFYKKTSRDFRHQLKGMGSRSKSGTYSQHHLDKQRRTSKTSNSRPLKFLQEQSDVSVKENQVSGAQKDKTAESAQPPRLSSFVRDSLEVN